MQEAWAFFSSPEFLRGQALHPGQHIIYTIRPILHIPITGVTLITEVDEPRSFTDTQKKGPYALWHHHHMFEPVPGGTLMKDHLAYAPPMGPLGELVHIIFVRKQLEGIFTFRQRTLKRLFPNTQ